MIEKMKKVVLFTLKKNRHEMLCSLQNSGVMHVADLVQKSIKIDSLDQNISEFKSVLYQLEEYSGKEVVDKPLLKPDELVSLNQKLVKMLSDKKMKEDELIKLNSEKTELEPWGEINLDDLEYLKANDVLLYFYTVGKKEYQMLLSDETVNFVLLKEVNKQIAIATISKPLDPSILANQFVPSNYSLSQLNAKTEVLETEIKQIESMLKESSVYISSYKAYLQVLDQDLMFEKVNETTLDVEDELSYLTGWIPLDKVDEFKKTARDNSWAYVIDDPGEEENPPTMVRYKGLMRIVKPVFDILGVVPGYREYDISTYFLIFFSLFFAMILGDGGYGLIFLAIAILLRVKSKKLSDINILLYVLSSVTIIWGALTGTWFGSDLLLKKLPFLKVFVIPSITNFPSLFNVASDYSQNMMMKFCFMLGACQLSLACVINIIYKIGEKNLSWVGDLGWLIDIVVLYLLVLQLVIGEAVNPTLVAGGIATGFVLVCLFGAQRPNQSFVKGVLAGLGDFFTTFLNTISCFSNIMSYIRLFAVGMASLAIAQSFNNMGAGLFNGLALPFGLLVIFLGHALNLVMGLLSVVVHGVRLNLLEFSGQLGMEWSGYKYEPFKKTVENNVVGNN